jgi:hypothetical protein
LVFEKNAIFSPKIGKNRRKWWSITSTPENISSLVKIAGIIHFVIFCWSCFTLHSTYSVKTLLIK